MTIKEKRLVWTLNWLKSRLNSHSDSTVQKYIRQVEEELESLAKKNRRL